MNGAKRRHRIVADANGRKTVESTLSFNNVFGGGGNTIIGGLMGNTGTYYGMLEGILMEDEQVFQAIYEDIYQYDVSCGTTVDLRSTLVASGFTLTGLRDAELEIFQSSINRLSFPNVLPQIYLDMYVRGKFISTLLYNRDKKEFADQMVHSAKDCSILDNPLYGGKPAIKFRPPESVIQFFKDDSDHAKRVRSRMNPEMVSLLSNSGQVDLDDLLTAYVPRPSVTGKARGVSMFKRVVPIYILEKTLYRGTISESQRRQRAIMHIQAGSDNWTPVNAELQGLVSLFQQADLDPTGAIVATRNDVNVGDVRSGGDFWRWTDTIDQTSQYKLRAMGVSEAFISGESTYAAMEISLSVFLENLRSDRDYVTQEMFNGHILPLIAHTNDLVHDKRKKELGYAPRGNGKSRGRLTGNIDFDISDPSKYKLPRLNWDKSLRPEADTEYLQTLDTLTEKGIPISMAMYASAAGVSIEEILNHQEKDVALMKRVKDYNKALEKVGGGVADLDEDDDYAIASARTVLSYQLEKAKAELQHKPKSLLTRLDSIAEETSEMYQGKKHHVPSARAARERTKQKDTAKRVITTLATNDNDWRNARRMAKAFISKNG